MGKVTFVGTLDVDKLTQAMSELLTQQYGAPLGARITVTAKPNEPPDGVQDAEQEESKQVKTA